MKCEDVLFLSLYLTGPYIAPYRALSLPLSQNNLLNLKFQSQLFLFIFQGLSYQLLTSSNYVLKKYTEHLPLSVNTSYSFNSSNFSSVQSFFSVCNSMSIPILSLDVQNTLTFFLDFMTHLCIYCKTSLSYS